MRRVAIPLMLMIVMPAFAAAQASLPVADWPGTTGTAAQVDQPGAGLAVPSMSVVNESRSGADEFPAELTGHARVDLVGQSEMWDAPPEKSASAGEHPEGWKSPWLAGGLSLVIPGSGEIYAGNYWKAAIFLAIEAMAITYAVTNHNKGDDQTAYYQSYAEAHWNVVRYAQWTEDNLAPASGAPYLWDLGNGQVNWSEVNRMEREIGGWYSHTLPPYQSQQYYELIGKYPQFAQGWDDAQPNASASYDEAKAELSYNYLYYSGERGKANDYYSKSQTGVIIIVVNHILSAADAAWTASSHNKGLNAGIGLQAVPPGARSLAGPAVKLSYGF